MFLLFVVFPGKGAGPGFSLSGRAFGSIPGSDLSRVGGFFYRKNAAFLQGSVKSTWFLMLWPLQGVLGRTAFMRIYGVPAHFAYIGQPAEGKLLCIFAVFPLTLLI